MGRGALYEENGTPLFKATVRPEQEADTCRWALGRDKGIITVALTWLKTES